MKKRIIKNISGFLVVVALMAILSGYVFALQVEQNVVKDSRQTIGQLQSLISKQIEDNILASDKKVLSSRKCVSDPNQINFHLGHLFVLTIFDAEIDYNKNGSYSYAIKDLQGLIAVFKGQSETASLEALLKSIINEEKSPEQIRQAMENVAKSYTNRQSGEQKWYFDSGATVSNLVIDSYMGDDKGIRKGLSELQKLTKLTPEKTPKEVLDSINSLAKHITATAFVEDDYAAIYYNALNLANLIMT